MKDGIVQKFERLVKRPEINIAQLTSLKRSKIHDILAGKSTLREADWFAFKAEYAEIRNLLRKVLDANHHDTQVKYLREIVKDARIKPFIFF